MRGCASAPRLDEIAHQGWKIDVLERLDGAGERAPLIRGDHLVPERDRLDAGHVGNLKGEDAADADIVVGLQHGIEVLFVERVDRRQILHGGDAAAQAFDRSQQGAGADLGRAALRVARRQRAQNPQLERDGFEAALQEHVVRMIVRIDEAGNDQLFSGVDRLGDRARAELGHRLLRRNGFGEPGPDGSNRAVDDQDVRDRRLIDIALVIVNAPALDQQSSLSNRICGHLDPRK